MQFHVPLCGMSHTHLALFMFHSIVHAQETTTSPPQLVVSTGVSGRRIWNRRRHRTVHFTFGGCLLYCVPKHNRFDQLPEPAQIPLTCGSYCRWFYNFSAFSHDCRLRLTSVPVPFAWALPKNLIASSLSSSLSKFLGPCVSQSLPCIVCVGV